MTDELKPCPFCGGDFQTWSHVRDGRALGCSKCGAGFVKYNGPKDDIVDRLVSVWNTRADAPVQPVQSDYGENTGTSVRGKSIAKVSSTTDAFEYPFQSRVAPWMNTCFGPQISADKLERGDRFLEEVLELLQSGDYPQERIAALTSYTYGRAKGEPAQEVGGVMVTLAAYCLAHGLDMHEAAETELARVWTKVEKIRAKQAAKPTGSALPVAVEAHADPRVQALVDAGKMVEQWWLEEQMHKELGAPVCIFALRAALDPFTNPPT